MYLSLIPSVERGYVLSLVVRRYISFYLQWDVDSSPSVERWCILLSSSSVVRRCISLQYFQWNVGMCYHQWYGGISLFISSVVRWYISLHVISGTVIYFSSCLQWNVGMYYRQWYVDELSLLCHQWYGGIFLFMPSVER